MIPDALREQTHVERALEPGAELLGEGLELLDRVKTVLLFVAALGLVLVAGAKLERYLMKRRLEVLDGAAGGETDIDLTEARGGDRG